MRAIKFRVWNDRRKWWEHGPGSECNLFGEMILLGGFMKVSIEELNDCIPCQYTGVNDKNGKEIYEGDILSYRSGLEYKVVWDDVYAKWHFTTITNQDGMYHIDIGQVRQSEVIGNIYESC